MYDTKSGKHTKLTTFAGEDRNPILSEDGKTVTFLSERTGSFNVHQLFAGQARATVETLTAFQESTPSAS